LAATDRTETGGEKTLTSVQETDLFETTNSCHLIPWQFGEQ